MKFGRARIQSDGSIIYPKKGWEPPPPIGGYDRDPGNKWRFVPKWKKCMHRIRLVTTRECGAINIIMMCQCPKADQYRKQTHLRHCDACLHRKEDETYTLG